MKYTIELSPEQVSLISEHLKRGVYNDVMPLVEEIASQVARQNFLIQQSELQEEARRAGLDLGEAAQ